MPLKNKLALLLIVLSSLLAATTHDSQALRLYQIDTGTHSVLTPDALIWLAGAWESRSAQHLRELQWSRPNGGTLLGFGRNIRNEQTADFEFMRIYQKSGALWLTVKAPDRPEAAFRLTRLEANAATFTNSLESSQHLYPDRIIYHLEASGALSMRLEGHHAGPAPCQQFTFKRSVTD